MYKKRLLIGMCSWNNPKLLKICINSILPNIDMNQDGIAVVLNQADEESIKFLLEKNIPFICLPENRGVLAIDYLIPFIQNCKYFLNTNDDMIFHKGFVEEIIPVMENNRPCSVSLGLVENFHSGNACVVVDEELTDFYSEEIINLFLNKAENKIYKTPYNIVSYNHPICTTASDYLKIGGYSGNWDINFISGYGRDDMFAFLLACLHSNFKFIGLNKSHVFHASSASMKRLPDHIRQQHNQDLFHQKTGYTLQEFREKIQIFAGYPRHIIS